MKRCRDCEWDVFNPYWETHYCFVWEEYRGKPCRKYKPKFWVKIRDFFRRKKCKISTD